MNNGKDCAAIETLALIRDGTYNTTRPDSVVIGELVQVIRLLDAKHTQLLAALTSKRLK